MGQTVTMAAQSASTITPNDTQDLTRVTRGIYVGASGTLKVDMADSSTVTFTALAAGVIHYIAAKRVYATGTSATTIIGLY